MDKKQTQLEIKTDQSAIQATPADLLQMAVSKDLDVEKLEKLMQLQQRYDAEKARKAFLTALTNFQYECPTIKKVRKVSFGTTKYSFAALNDITAQIKDLMKTNGLSYRWELKDNGDKIECYCIISHIDGHSEKTMASAEKDASGGKNTIQQRGSTITYLQRYSLISALGISTADTDTDGIAPKKKELMSPQHPKWLSAIKALAAGQVTIQQIKTQYELTSENEALIKRGVENEQ